MNHQTYTRDAPSYLLEFLNYAATVKGRSENTIKSYYTDLKLYLRFIKQKHGLAASGVNFKEIKIADLPENIIKNSGLNDALEFLHFISSVRGNSAKSRARRAVALRQFYKYLTYYKAWFSVSPLDRLEMPSLKKPLPKHLTYEQALELLRAAAVSETSGILEARDYCILTLFLNCGMRLSELVGLNATDYRQERDFDTDDQYVHTLRVTGKGSKERVIYLNGACVDALEAYIGERTKLLSKNKKLSDEKAMFLSRNNKQISNRRVEEIVENALKKSGLNGLGFSPHKLRHTAATLMFQNGVDVRVLKEVLGHENLGTTQIYTHVANKQVKEAMEKNPLGGNIKKEEI
ncbi:MAG: tyrosine-type recombinase/integrase [Oscillospiraceae bacterium]|jgi:site-specific recombinase XerD|nr:tyrosine-type recombinase/integrase [Oscillospiraceae bacterium]